MTQSKKVSAFFQQGGGLSDTLSHFELREGQVQLVDAIETAIENRQHLIAEAGTGIGKTFSYLLPALFNQKQVFVSTATKHLQDQIFFKDLPIIEKAIGRKVSACLLKGRSNYFCHYRYETFFQSAFKLTKRQSEQSAKLLSWSKKTTSGDLSEVTDFIDEDQAFQKKISSTAENCLAGECPYFDECFVQKVRERAKKSEVVIVNHALLMADIVLKQTGFAEILPEVDVVVIDEAHHLPKIATQAFAQQISANQLVELAKDSRQAYLKEAGDIAGFEDTIEHLLLAIREFREALAEDVSEGQIQLGQLKQLKKPYQQFKLLMQAFAQYLQAMEILVARSAELNSLYERSQEMAERIKMIFMPAEASTPSESESQNDGTKSEIEPLTTVQQSVAILEWREDYFCASRLPIHLGYRFRDIMSAYADSWIFVSATLSVGASFNFFINALGLPSDLPTLIVDSPFDYPNHAVIHVLADLPNPNAPDFVKSLVKASLPILRKTKGRAFMLFTSYRNLHEAAERMADSEFRLFVQGDMPKAQLIEAFINSDNSVLMGTVSFWEGVDVAGEQLSCVIIDKIPFPSPADPIIAEQARFVERQGGNAFASCYIPKAATLLKQGAGRLIRSHHDKGVLVFGDNRLIHKGYGKQLIKAMPPAKQVNREDLFSFIEKKLV